MLAKPGVGQGDAGHGVAKPAAYCFAGAFDVIGRPAESTGEAVGGGQLLDQRVELLTGRGVRFSVASFLGLLERFQRIRYHRRGLGGSTRPVEAGPTSVAVQAEDAVGLLDHVGADRAHVVGHSLGGAIALELAAQHPTRMASLVLLEPMLLTTPAGAAFARAMAPLTERYEAGDAEGAVHGFLALVGDRNWHATIEQTVPGGIAQAVKDAATFFETELPGAPSWTFGPERAAAITCPVLSVLGTQSSPLFVEGRQLLHTWFPACQDADIVGATHLLQMQAPGPVAAAIAAFL